MSFPLWSSADWQARATAWLDTQLDATGRVRTGPLEQLRLRPWGTVSCAPTDAGRVWLKAPAASLRFELPLLQALDGLGVDGVPRVLGAEPGLGLVLLADAGVSLVERWPDRRERAAPFVGAWTTVGAVQRASAPLVPDLLAAGVADLRPSALPARFDAALARARADHGDDLADLDALDRLAARRSRFVEVCEELATSRVPVAVDHNDVHDNNIAVDPSGRPVLLDWGDAVVAHPFATLVTAEKVLATLLGDVAPDHPRLAAARTAYVEGFRDLAPGEDLQRTARLARAGAQIGRAWVWQRALDTFADAGAFEPPSDWPPDFARGALRPLVRAVDELDALT